MIRRSFLAPEVIQTSGMDCGPATLVSILRGVGERVVLDEIRDLCQTDVDGTSIEALEAVAQSLGLDSEQISVPWDFLTEPETAAFPCIIVSLSARRATHFIVLWRRVGNLVQVMDPAIGRRWIPLESLRRDLLVHSMPVPAAAWREWASTAEFAAPLERHLAAVVGSSAKALVAEALADESEVSLGALDAATRMVAALRRAGALGSTSARLAMVRALVAKVRENPETAARLIPPQYWSARPLEAEPDQERHVLVRGLVLVRMKGRLKPEVAVDRPDAAEPDAPIQNKARSGAVEPMGYGVREFIRSAGLAPFIVTFAIAALMWLGLGQSLLYRSLLDVGDRLAVLVQRLVAGTFVVATATVLGVLTLAYLGIVQRVGRRFDLSLRVSFFRRVPRLGDRYFRSRPLSDSAERAHQIHELRELPTLLSRFASAIIGLAVTAAGIAWIDPPNARLAVAAACAVGILPLAFWPAIRERDLRARTQTGALMRFSLDALLGSRAARSFGAERGIRAQHEQLLVEWLKSTRARAAIMTAAELVQALVATALCCKLVLSFASRGGDSRTALLVVFWVQAFAFFGQDLLAALRDLPMIRNALGRVAEPLVVPLEDTASDVVTPATAEPDGGAVIEFEDVDVVAAGHRILGDVNLSFRAGEHVAIVGSSGAGKSSLLGVLLGFHRHAKGTIRVDGREFDDALRADLRRSTAWVDPGVHLWNRTVLENLGYGIPYVDPEALARAVEDADLAEIIARMPKELQSPVGENGGLMSGGEGQRVRLARTLVRGGIRLALLDEPFRGLEGARRLVLLERVRRQWENATLLYVTHDVEETLRFDRVIVVDGGRIVEDGPPRKLASEGGTHLRAMLDDARALREVWSRREAWRRVRLLGGKLLETRGGGE